MADQFLPPLVASDKLFFWLFQERSDRLQPLVAHLLDSMEGYSFSAPAIKELGCALMACSCRPPISWPTSQP